MSNINFDGMSWPHPDDASRVEWRLRYGASALPLKPEERLEAAAIIAAYRQLIGDTLAVSRSKLSRIKKALRRAGSAPGEE